MRQFQNLDPVALKAFYFASEALNFTRAAQAAGLTQSGISQHVRKLEEELGTELFQRSRRSVRLTPAGAELRRFVEGYLDSIDTLFEKLHSEGQAVRGLVRYAMPDSCLYTPHFPLLLERRAKDLREIELKVKICDSERVVECLRAGEIDFGFVTRPLESRDLKLEEFAREEFVLVANQKQILKISSPQDLRAVPFVRYPGMDVLFDHWQECEFPRGKPVRADELSIQGEINSIKGAIAMAQKGVGLCVFQRQCVHAELQAKTLHAFQTKSGRKPENRVFIVTPREQALPLRVRTVIDAFWDMKKT